MLRRDLSPMLVLLLLLGCAGTRPAVDPALWQRDAAWLSDPAREGRGLATEGLTAAARHLAERFAEAGLAPGAPDGSFFQRFRMPVEIAVAESQLALGGEGLARDRDYRVLLGSENGAFAGPLVFAGYGIHDPSQPWDDWAQLDVKDAVVLVLDGRPELPAFADRRGAALGRRGVKLMAARERGARAVLFAPGLEGDGQLGPADPMGALPTRSASGVIALALSRDATERALRHAGLDRAALVRAGDRRFRPALAAVRAQGSVRILRREAEVVNVIGTLPGSDLALAAERVVIGAHYDHLGQGEFGSLNPSSAPALHPGADDNASGAAGLVALARAIARGPRPARTLDFVAFTAEEAGLIGSAHYVEALPRPAAQAPQSGASSEAQPSGVKGLPQSGASSEAQPSGVIAMVNLDMIGRLGENGVTVFGAESAPGYAEFVRAAAERRGLRLAFEDGIHGPSDHASFHAARIPALFFTTGAHSAYHTPDDTAAGLRPAGAARVLDLVADVTLALGNAAQPPRFASVPLAAHAPPSGDGGGYGPYLGTVPAFGDAAAGGAKLAAVRAGSPAEQAGLRAGDVIVEFAGSRVANLEEFAALLFAQREGARVQVVVRRGNERFETNAVLGRRR